MHSELNTVFIKRNVVANLNDGTQIHKILERKQNDPCKPLCMTKYREKKNKMLKDKFFINSVTCFRIFFLH